MSQEITTSTDSKTGIVPRDILLAHDGLTLLQLMLAGDLPPPPMAETLGFALHEVASGRVVFAGTPQERHLNPFGTVHAGFAATLLDSALACAIQTTLTKGETHTTLELKLNLVRALTPQVGPVFAEGRLIHRGRSIATADGMLRDAEGKLYAHATTTCMIFPAKE